QADRRVVVHDLVVSQPRHIHRLHDAFEGTEEIEDVRILELDRLVGALRFGAGPHATDRVTLGEVTTQPVQRVSGCTEPLVSHKLLHELEARIGRVEAIGRAILAVLRL
ncbi:MAG: hypothetical protein ACK56I_00660, partial [bacterium]